MTMCERMYTFPLEQYATTLSTMSKGRHFQWWLSPIPRRLLPQVRWHLH